MGCGGAQWRRPGGPRQCRHPLGTRTVRDGTARGGTGAGRGGPPRTHRHGP
ncbi:hypothetical protein ACFFX0_06455 [Citricoccus parietis]|uniref:Uncharacterized protein n=1 Tax=Citricoccus parietis TaxID=592307 RepID=A0ABV5FW20_9MICC